MANDNPTVIVRLDESYLTRTESGEILEALLDEDGEIDWPNAICADYRGGGGSQGYEALQQAFDALETAIHASSMNLVRLEG